MPPTITRELVFPLSVCSSTEITQSLASLYLKTFQRTVIRYFVLYDSLLRFPQNPRVNRSPEKRKIATFNSSPFQIHRIDKLEMFKTACMKSKSSLEKQTKLTVS